MIKLIFSYVVISVMSIPTTFSMNPTLIKFYVGPRLRVKKYFPNSICAYWTDSINIQIASKVD